MLSVAAVPAVPVPLWESNCGNALQMVEGGWYFCPNEESNDLATCPYCKLSLDGWEPKDDPL